MTEITIILIVYNHENYVQDAVESILKQYIDKKTCEIIIAEDFSSDRTRLLIDQFDFSDYYRCLKLYRPGNIGFVENLADAITNAQGKYIALLSGDDFWTSPEKLSIQKKILDSQLDCQIVYTGVELLKNNNLLKPDQSYIKNKSTLADVNNLLRFDFGINA